MAGESNFQKFRRHPFDTGEFRRVRRLLAFVGILTNSITIDAEELAAYSQAGYLGVLMGRVRGVLAATLSIAMLATPLWSAPAPASQLGIVVFADRAKVGIAIEFEIALVHL